MSVTEVPLDKDVLRVVEKCLDVLLTTREENHKTARFVAEALSMPRFVVNTQNRREAGHSDGS